MQVWETFKRRSEVGPYVLLSGLFMENNSKVKFSSLGPGCIELLKVGPYPSGRL